jgi:3-methyladenine DNA glycosylase AlkD
MTVLRDLTEELRGLADPEKARVLQRFFKTGPGEYAEGDRFLGIVVPQCRAVAKKYGDLSRPETIALLTSPFHEERLVALLILIDQFRKGSAATKEEIYRLYLAHTAHINNWDLVDLSAEYLVGAYLDDRPKEPLFALARSESLWERRIAILATFHFIKKGRYDETLAMARILLHDPHDLIRKAVGWLLREVGKRCSREAEEAFLRQHCREMPRTMLRYAIERFTREERKQYMTGEAAGNDPPGQTGSV